MYTLKNIKKKSYVSNILNFNGENKANSFLRDCPSSNKSFYTKHVWSCFKIFETLAPCYQHIGALITAMVETVNKQEIETPTCYGGARSVSNLFGRKNSSQVKAWSGKWSDEGSVISG